MKPLLAYCEHHTSSEDQTFTKDHQKKLGKSANAKNDLKVLSKGKCLRAPFVRKCSNQKTILRSGPPGYSGFVWLAV